MLFHYNRVCHYSLPQSLQRLRFFYFKIILYICATKHTNTYDTKTSGTDRNNRSISYFGLLHLIALSPKETAIKIITWSVIIAVHFIAWAVIFLFLAKNTTNSND